MEKSFQRSNSVLYFRPKASTRWSKLQYLLWPAWYYKVVAPKGRSRQINILQKAVLGVCQAGSFNPEEISENLGIAKDLSALVLAQLSELNFIDNYGLITHRGRDILAKETIEEEELVAGYVFQDPWRGDLWPRFVNRLEYAEVKYNERGYPSLVFGTRGKPRKERAYMPFPVENTIVRQPEAAEILNAVKKHYRTQKNRDDFAEWEEEGMAEEIKRLGDVPNLKRISLIEEEPTPVWLATYFYVPENALDATLWNVCDPFGLGDSLWLRRRVDKMSREIPLLGERILGAIASVTDSSQEEVAALIARLEAEAEKRVEQKLTLNIRQSPVFETLVMLEREYRNAEVSQKPENLDDVLVKAQKVCEHILQINASKYPEDASYKLLTKDRKYNNELLKELAKKLGFKTPLPSALLNSSGQVKQVAKSGRGSFRPLLLAVLLTAKNELEHPFRRVAKTAPDMLHRLDELASKRNESGHYSGQQQNFSEVSRQVDTVYQFVALNLGINYYQLETIN